MNKLGISDWNFESIERKIVNLKLNIIDENFTFNKKQLNFNYLISLNRFLFGDFYYERDLGIRDMHPREIECINIYLKSIEEICLKNFYSIDSLLNILRKIWLMQPFKVGNTRTLVAYLKVISLCFRLDINVNVNKEIKSDSKEFNFNCEVNQKRLTKVKQFDKLV